MRALAKFCYDCYMRSIPHRELRNNSSEVLRQVEAGESLTITNHGKPVARLVPVESALPPLRSRPASKAGDFRSLVQIELDHPAQTTIDELRGDR